jgi:large subunit ribosomal protein L6
VTIAGQNVAVKGPKGELALDVHPAMRIALEEGVMTVARPDDSAPNRSLHGLTRTLLSNMVTGVTTGFEKKLEIVGVGYRASKKGSDLEILVGYSHPVVVEAPENIEFDVPVPTQIMVRGIDKQRVGQVAAEIRALRKPEPYKGKGIRYEGEVVRRKVGKRA